MTAKEVVDKLFTQAPSTPIHIHAPVQGASDNTVPVTGLFYDPVIKAFVFLN